MDTEKNEGDAKAQPDKGLEESNAPAAIPDRRDTESNACPCQNKAACAENLPWWKDSQWWQFIVAAVVVPFGIYAAVFVYPNQLVEMRKTTANQLKAFEVDERAWVGEDTVMSRPKENEPWDIIVLVRNTGKTFATNCVVYIDTRNKELSEADPDFDGILDEAGGSAPFVLAPNSPGKAELHMWYEKNVTKEDLEALGKTRS